MMQRKYTLPRHTNLASQGLRFASSIVDFAITLALILGFFFGCFNIIVGNVTKPMSEQLDTYYLESHLKVRKDDGTVAIIDYTNLETMENAIEAYYLRYLPGKPLEGEGVAPNYNTTINVDGVDIPRSEYYNVEYFNYYVLGITQENPDGDLSTSYFTYQKDADGNFLKDRIGIKRDHAYDEDAGKVITLDENSFITRYQYIYIDASTNLVSQDFYRSVSDHLYFLYEAAIAVSIVIAGIITYIIIPTFLKNGQTIAKKIFKLGLANYDGYKFQNWQLWPRFVIYFVVAAAIMLPVWTNPTYYILLVIGAILISFAFMMASPKRSALHDFAARTIVVDLESSIIFENEIEEDAYIAKEDGLPLEGEENNG